MQGVRGKSIYGANARSAREEHLQTPAHKEQNAWSAGIELRAPAPKEPMQGMQGSEHLRAPSPKEPLQGMQGSEHLRASGHEEVTVLILLYVYKYRTNSALTISVDSFARVYLQKRAAQSRRPVIRSHLRDNPQVLGEGNFCFFAFSPSFVPNSTPSRAHYSLGVTRAIGALTVPLSFL